MPTVRWGLLSTAMINRRVIPAIRASSRGQLAAVASRSLAHAQAYAQEWEIPHTFGSYAEMLASDKIDAVYIGLPNHLHAEWTITALEAGKHVLIEKPFALSIEEADRMIAASRKTGCALAEAFMYRHHPQMKAAGNWVHSGKLGDILSVQGVFTFLLTETGNVRLVPEYGGGCLWDVGVYPLSFAQYIYQGIPNQVFGYEWRGTSGVDESFSGLMKYPNGGTAQIFSSFRSEFNTHAEVIGSEGRLILNRPFVNMVTDGQVMVYPNDSTPFSLTFESKELYLGEIEDMHAAIIDQAPTYIALEESRNHIRTVLALYRSITEMQPVQL